MLASFVFSSSCFAAPATVSQLSVDYRALVSQDDAFSRQRYPYERTGEKLKFQVNVPGVYSSNAYSTAMSQSGSDYSGGGGFLDIDFGTSVLNRSVYSVHRYDGEETVEAEGLRVRFMTVVPYDVIAIHIAEAPLQVKSVNIDLGMLRPPVVRTRGHTATSVLEQRGDNAILTQVFEEPAASGVKEGDFYCASAVVVMVPGRDSSIQRPKETQMRISVPAGQGAITILIGTAASFDRREDVVNIALAKLQKVPNGGFEELVAANRVWWHDFWSKSFVYFPDHSGISHGWYRGLYDSVVRGMARMGGPRGDNTQWGSRSWEYPGMCGWGRFFAANHIESLDRFFRQRTAAYEAYATAARQEWGSSGIFISETTTVFGPAKLPEGIAEDLQNLLLWQKEPTDRLMKFAWDRSTLEGRWSWRGEPLKGGPTSHDAYWAALTAELYWRKYQYTGDKVWLKEQAYPMIRGAAEFYRHFPRLQKEADGKYHISGTSLLEDLRVARDVINDHALMRGILPVAIRASEILGIDAELRPAWQEILDNLAPYPMSSDPGAIGPLKREDGLPTWAMAKEPALLGNSPSLYRMGFSQRMQPLNEFDVLTLETRDQGLDEGQWAIAMNTMDVHPLMEGYRRRRFPQGDSRFIKELSRTGRADDCAMCQSVNAAKMGQGLGAVMNDATQEALLLSITPSPAADPVIRVFPTWPRSWDAAFQMLAKGGFLVTSSLHNQMIEFVEIDSQFGGPCRIRNPWPESKVIVYQEDKKAKTRMGSLLVLPTQKGDRLILVREGTQPDQLRRTITLLTILADRKIGYQGDEALLRVSGLEYPGQSRVKYSSDKSEIVQVGTAGQVKAMGVGTATITAQAVVNGQKRSATKQFTIKERDLSLDRRGWIVTAAHDAAKAHGVLVDRQGGYWAAPAVQGQWLQIDMGQEQTLYSVQITDPGPGERTGGFVVYLSRDGQDWGEPVAKVKEEFPTTTARFRPQSARFFRVALLEDSKFPWAVRDVAARAPMPELRLEANRATLNMEQTTRLKLSSSLWNSADLKRATVTYASKDDRVATVDGEGRVKAVNAGEAILTVEVSLEGETKTASVPIMVTADVQLDRGERLDGSGWTASSSYQNDWPGREPQRVLDSPDFTAWTSGEPMRKGGWFMIDMKSEHTVCGFEMTKGHFSQGFPRQCSVYLSNDNKNWGSPVYSTMNSPGNIRATFAQQSARYLKIEDTMGYFHPFWWYITHLYVFGHEK